MLEAAEDAETLMETMDLQRCLMLPFASPRVAAQLQQWMADAVRRRNEHFTQRIDETLGEDEVGLLLVGERHQLQFPQDIEVFYVAPPALDEYRRWVDAWIARQRAAQAEEGDGHSGIPIGLLAHRLTLSCNSPTLLSTNVTMPVTKPYTPTISLATQRTNYEY